MSIVSMSCFGAFIVLVPLKALFMKTKIYTLPRFALWKYKLGEVADILLHIFCYFFMLYDIKIIAEQINWVNYNFDFYSKYLKEQYCFKFDSSISNYQFILPQIAFETNNFVTHFKSICPQDLITVAFEEICFFPDNLEKQIVFLKVLPHSKKQTQMELSST